MPSEGGKVNLLELPVVAAVHTCEARTGYPTAKVNTDERCPCCDPPKKSPNKKFWGLAVPGRADITRLKKQVLTHGGDRFQRNDLLDLQLSHSMVEKLSENGKYSPGQPARLLQMADNECHNNAAKLARQSPSIHWFGFALSEDSCWRLHSWCEDAGQIIETTELRTAYHGVPYRN